MPAKKNASFEENLGSLETLIDQLDSGELSLEQALKQFEQGVKLSGDCQTQLQSAEQQIKILSEKQGKMQLDEFKGSDS